MTDPAENPDRSAGSRRAPKRSARRAQTAIDSGAALVLTVLVWPFPLARAALAPAVNVLCILVLWQLVQVAFFTVTMSVWGATAGTRIMGLEVIPADGIALTRGQRALWGALSGAVALVRIVAPVREGERDAPERAARVEVVSIVPDG